MGTKRFGNIVLTTYKRGRKGIGIEFGEMSLDHIDIVNLKKAIKEYDKKQKQELTK